MPVNNLERSSLVAFARKKAVDERKWATSRRDSAEIMDGATAHSLKAASLIRFPGQRKGLKAMTIAEARESAARDRRIALKHDDEAQVFDAIADMLDADGQM